jgi:hypothetical protein
MTPHLFRDDVLVKGLPVNKQYLASHRRAQLSPMLPNVIATFGGFGPRQSDRTPILARHDLIMSS